MSVCAADTVTPKRNFLQIAFTNLQIITCQSSGADVKDGRRFVYKVNAYQRAQEDNFPKENCGQMQQQCSTY